MFAHAFMLLALSALLGLCIGEDASGCAVFGTDMGTAPWYPVNGTRIVRYDSLASTELALSYGDRAVVAAFNAMSANMTIIRREYNVPYGYRNTVRDLRDMVPRLSVRPSADAITPYMITADDERTQQYFEPIDDIWAGLNLDQYVLPSISRQCRAGDGHYYYLPLLGDLAMLYYRTTELADMGFAPPRTLDELRAICVAYRAAGRRCVSMRQARNYGPIMLFDMVLMRMWGAELVRELQRGDVPFTDERIAAAGRLLAQLGADAVLDLRGQLSDTPPGWTRDHRDFTEKRAGFYYGYDLFRPLMAPSDRATVGIVQWPHMDTASLLDAPIVSVATLLFMALPKNAGNIEGGRQFLRFYNSPLGKTIFLNNSILWPLPLTMDAMSSPRIANDPVRTYIAHYYDQAADVLPETANVYRLPLTHAVLLDGGFDLWIANVSVRTVNESMAVFRDLMLRLEAHRTEELFSTCLLPVATPSGGVFSADVRVQLFSATPGATIYYTLDGTYPAELVSPQYDADQPIVLRGPGEYVVTAFAARDLLRRSPMLRASFTIVPTDAPQAYRRSVAAITVALSVLSGMVVCLVVACFMIRRERRRARRVKPLLITQGETDAADVVVIEPMDAGASQQVLVRYKVRFRASLAVLHVVGAPLSSLNLAREQRVHRAGLEGNSARLTSGEPASAADGEAQGGARRGPRWRCCVCLCRCCCCNGAGGGGGGAGSGGGSCRWPWRKSHAASADGEEEDESSVISPALPQLAHVYHSFLADARALTLLRHTNVVSIVGYVVSPRVCILSEYMAQGTLHQLIERRREHWRSVHLLASLERGAVSRSSVASQASTVMTPGMQSTESPLLEDGGVGHGVGTAVELRLMQHVALGMQYLHSVGLAHGSLTSFSVELNEAMIAKVVPPSKLGLGTCAARTSAAYRSGVPWQAPEQLTLTNFRVRIATLNASGFQSLHHATSSRHLITEGRPVDSWDAGPTSKAWDVYAFGVLAWELLSMTELYPTMTESAIATAVQQGTLQPPLTQAIEVGQPDMYPLLQSCWQANDANRPTFGQIVDRLGEISARKGRLQETMFAAVAPRRDGQGHKHMLSTGVSLGSEGETRTSASRASQVTVPKSLLNASCSDSSSVRSTSSSSTSTTSDD